MNSSSVFSSEQPEQPFPQKYRWERVLEIAEIGPASLCSWILSQYAGELDPAETNQGHVINYTDTLSHVLAHIHHPAPRLVLVAALGFGCCVSSFVYRRQGEDPFQVVVFALVVGTVATVAYGAGASPDTMLLGLMPFAACAAMAISVLGHAMFRSARPRGKEWRVESQEKVQLL